MEKKHVRCKDYTDTIGIMQNRTFPVVDFLRPKNDGPRNRKLAINRQSTTRGFERRREGGKV
jgi:hypothetical protein